MFIISNDCMSGHLYTKYHHIFNHPFMWCVIPYADIVNMMINFKTIAWDNLSLDINNYIKKDTVKLTIDNRIHLYGIHLFCDNSKHTIERNRGNLFGPKESIFNYARDAYYRRLDRMQQVNEDPIFVIHEELPSSPKSVLNLIPTTYKVFTILSSPIQKQFDTHYPIQISTRGTPFDDMQYLIDALNKHDIKLS